MGPPPLWVVWVAVIATSLICAIAIGVALVGILRALGVPYWLATVANFTVSWCVGTSIGRPLARYIRSRSDEDRHDRRR